MKKNVRLPRALCAAVADLLNGSHDSLEAIFMSAGAPGEPPNLAHHSKWKEWLFRAGKDESVDSLAVLGGVLEEFMDIAPQNESDHKEWIEQRARVVAELESNSLRYFRGGQILETGSPTPAEQERGRLNQTVSIQPTSIDELLRILIKGLPRAIFPLTNRRKGSHPLSFDSEYDIQDLLHTLLRPWISDVRPEEFTPSYAGSSTRMDFLLPQYGIVIETKLVRSRNHGTKIGDELVIDIAHYSAHPNCKNLWCVIYDPNHFISNPGGLINDLEGKTSTNKGALCTKVFVL